MATANIASESKKSEQRRLSCDTWCSSNSNCVLQKRKPLHPLATSLRTRTSNPITQRLSSAKQLKFKTLQNKLNDANFHVAQLLHENKALQTIQKRQDYALSRYEGSSAKLPQVLESHQEEIRTIQAKLKDFRKKVTDLTDRLKTKDEELNTLRDQNKHLMALCKNKHLEERDKLRIKVEDLNDRLRESEKTISVLNRKILLESKNHKFTLNAETSKHKKAQDELARALSQIKNLNVHAHEKEKFTDPKLSQLVPIEMKREPISNTSNNRNHRVQKHVTIKIDSPKSNRSPLLNKSDESLDQEHSSSSEKDLSTRASNSTNYLSLPRKVFDEDSGSSSETQLKEIVEQWHKNKKTIEDNVDNDSDKDEFDDYFDGTISTASTSKTSIVNDNMFNTSLENNHFLNEKEYISDKFNCMKITDDLYSDFVNPSRIRTNGLLPHLSHNNTKCKYSFEEELLSGSITNCTDSQKPDIKIRNKNELIAKLNSVDNTNNVVISEVTKSKREIMKELFG